MNSEKPSRLNKHYGKSMSYNAEPSAERLFEVYAICEVDNLRDKRREW